MAESYAAGYCTEDRLRDRLTEACVRWFVDNDRNGTLAAEEVTAVLGAAIEWASNKIDAALAARMPTSLPRGQDLPYLRDLCVDIAAYRAAGHGGRDVHTTLRQAYDDARAELRLIEDGKRLPGLVGPAPANATLEAPRMAYAANMTEPKPWRS